MRHIIKTLPFFLLFFGISFSALIDPQLLSILEKASPNEKIPVDFALKERVNALKLDPTIENLPRPQRRARVGRVLMDFAERTQRDLLNYLRGKEQEGKVSNIVSLWIVNLVGCLATPDVIYEVANRTDIDFVLYAKVPVELTPIKEVVPRDFTESIQPNLLRINVRGAWKQGYTGQGIVIGVVDTGVRYTHEDLRNHLWTSTVYPKCGFNVASNQMNFGHPGPSSYDTLTPLDYYGHGTHCAGITSADGTYGNGTRDTMGVAPSALIMSVPVDVYVHSPYPDTSLEKSMWFGLQFCVRPPRDTLNGADVITMSLGLTSTWLPRRRLHREVEENILAAGITHCVAAGNEGASKLRVPGNCPPPWPHPQNVGQGAPSAVISIGATDNNDNIASFSSRGPTRGWDTIPPWNDYSPYLMDPDVCAPGVSILSTSYSGDRSYTTMSGTSMATPHVAGCVALMLSKNPYLTPRQIDSILEMHAIVDLGATGKDTVFGAGRIDCSLAVAFTPPPIMHDVGVVALISPTGTIDSGTTITPACTLNNYGTEVETYNVRMKIGTFYNEVAQISNHNPGEKIYVAFPDWIANQRGAWVASCSTELDGDLVPTNDKQERTINVSVRDVGVTVLLLPDTITYGTTITPVCSVYNFGTDSESYTVRMKIAGYEQRVNITNHMPQTALQVTFPPDTLPPGNHPVRCSTELSVDVNPSNDLYLDAIFVKNLDVGVIGIIAPIGIIDSGTTQLPKALIKNFGNLTATFPCRFTIGNFYLAETTATLLPQETDTITFIPWIARPVGVHITKCTTALNGDLNPNNNYLTDSCRVRSTSGIKDLEITKPLSGRPSIRILSNPFGSQTTIYYQLPLDIKGSLEIYNACGKLVKSFTISGVSHILWDGTDEQGKKLPRGIYFYQIITSDFKKTVKVIKLE